MSGTDDAWNQQNWIKDVLSKSGTDIVEIKDEDPKDLCKMVYYPALPLIMKPENKDVQLCTPLGGDTQKYQSSPPQQHEHPLLQHRQVINNNGTTLNQTTNLSISCGQGFLHTVKTEQMQQVSLIQQMHLEPQSNTSNSFAIQNGEKFHFKCEKCNMIFGSKSAHTSHMKSHSNQDNNFHTVIPTSEHLSTTTSGSDPYQCNVCKKTFAVPARLIRHYRTHTGERPFECEFCHKMFSVKENLQVHRRIHTKERPYKCDICGRAFEHSGKLHRHMRIHTGERPHKCSVCSKTFIQSGQLVIHMRTHTGEKPYKCPVEGCGKGFTCSKQLKVHSRTHTGEKPYHCDICFRDFGYNHVLKLHRVQHYGSKCYKCTICDETFKSKKEMEAHIKGHANEIRDEEEENTSQPSLSSVKQESIQYRESPPKEKSLDNTSLSAITTATFDTPQESSSEPTSDNGEDANNYYNIYQILDESQQRRGVDFSLHQTRTRSINPALLAAASLASRKVDESPAAPSTTLGHTFSPAVLNITTSPTQMDVISNSTGINEVNISYKQSSLVVHKNTATSSNSFVYEPLSVMRQHGYFAPAPVPEYRPSLRAANDIVRRVEAAIAGAEPLITPPRSSTESPDRSLSPESDSMLMADRDVMTLPLRKRKVYLTDNQSSQDVPPAVRMNSVIQFARAS